MVDVDELAFLEEQSLTKDTLARVEYACSLLSAEFQDGSVLWQMSASADVFF